MLLSLRKEIYTAVTQELPPLHVLWSAIRDTPSGHPQERWLLGRGKQNVLQSPLLTEHF